MFVVCCCSICRVEQFILVKIILSFSIRLRVLNTQLDVDVDHVDDDVAMVTSLPNYFVRDLN